jgi:hypothetical protein
MGQLSTYGRTVMVNSVFRPEAAAVLGGAYMALTLAVPVDTDTGSSILEPTASSFERVPYGLGTYFWTMMSPGQVANTQQISWVIPTDNWGQVIGWALCTESTSGMVLAFGRLRRSMAIVAGQRLKVPPGSLRVSLL